MANVSCFYKTPAQAEKIGLSVTTTESISNSDAIALADAYKNVDTAQSIFLGIAIAPLAAAIVKTGLAKFGMGVTTSVATGYSKSFIGQLQSAYEIVARSGSKCNSVRCTYKYRRKGSNDGAYWLESVTIL